MNEVESSFPFAKVLLHAKFHVGGCSKCGYEDNETLNEVALKHSKNGEAMVQALNDGLQEMAQAEISPEKVKMILDSIHQSTLFVDVREPWEFDMAHLPGSVLLQEDNMDTVFRSAKKSEMVILVCHHGVRSLNAALFFRQNGIKQAYSLAGGLERYALAVDSSIPRY